jgi:hypothetical protein
LLGYTLLQLDSIVEGMEDEDSDVVFEEEWEEVQGPQVAAPATAATGSEDITIHLNGVLVA